MMNILRVGSLSAAIAAVGLLAAIQGASAQQAAPADKDNRQQQHMQGGTVPGAGTHGHSSSPKPGETKDIQQKQHNMPATPSHSSGPKN